MSLTVRFYLPRPKSLPKRVTEHTKKPDLDKLLRAVLDACTTGGVWRDDSQVATIHARKVYAGDADLVGCDIVVHTLEDYASTPIPGTSA